MFFTNKSATMRDLPPDLQNIVCMFAYNTTLALVKRSVAIYLVIRSMNLPFFFFKLRIWCWHERKFIKNPLDEFVPIETVGGRIGDLFDDDGMYCFLLALDFRRKKVKMFGSRERWLHRLASNWCTVEPFAAYYRMLLREGEPFMKKRKNVSHLIGCRM